MPDVFVYAGYLAALTKRIKIGTAVVTLPLANPLRVAENTAFVDVLSNGRFALGLGSGYRKYEFDGFGIDFEARRDIQEEALPLLLDLLHYKRAEHHGDAFASRSAAHYEVFPQALQQPHPPIFLAGATDRSIGVAGRFGLRAFSLQLDAVRRTCAAKRELSRAARPKRRKRCATIRRAATSTWPAGSMLPRPTPRPSARAKPGIMRNLAHFGSGHASGYLGTVSQDVGAKPRDYDTLARDIILHGSPATVIAKIEDLRAKVRNASIMLHFPPWYGHDKALASLELFAAEVMPKFRDTSRTQRRA